MASPCTCSWMTRCAIAVTSDACASASPQRGGGADDVAGVDLPYRHALAPHPSVPRSTSPPAIFPVWLASPPDGIWQQRSQACDPYLSFDLPQGNFASSRVDRFMELRPNGDFLVAITTPIRSYEARRLFRSATIFPHGKERQERPGGYNEDRALRYPSYFARGGLPRG